MTRGQAVFQRVIVCTVDADFAGRAGRIHVAIEAAGDLRGRLIRVNRPLG